MIAVVIPTLNAAETLSGTLAALIPAAIDGLIRHVVIVDGGSTDATLQIAEASGAEVIQTAPGRGSQIAAGIAAVRQPFVVVLHADARPEPGYEGALASFVASRHATTHAAYFQLALDDPCPEARRLERWVAWRAATFGLPYGDQGLVVAKALLDQVGGYPDLVLMEDVALARALGRRRWLGLNARVVTRARKHEVYGYWRQSARNLVLLARYLLGADPATLAKAYR